MSDSNSVACFAESSFEAKYRLPPLLQQRVHVTQPVRNSAPSRLQNIDDFYLVGNYSSLCGSKARSLTDLFTFERDARCCVPPTRAECACNGLDQSISNLTDDMPLPNGLSEDDDYSSEFKQDEALCNGDSNVEVFSGVNGDDVTSSFDVSDVAASLEADVSDISLPSNEEEKESNETTMTCVSQSPAERRSSYPQSVVRSLSDSSCDVPPVRKLQRRKSVHFADTKGFDLEIKIPFCRELEETNTPPRLLEALEKVRAEIQGRSGNGIEIPISCSAYNNEISCFALSPQFQQPFLDANFQRRVCSQMVCLESVAVIPNSRSLTGVIRVVNIEFEKQVTVRYSTDGWRTHDDIPACYVASQHDINQDQFSFHVVAPSTLHGGNKIELAIRYKLNQSKHEFWDNNNGTNYIITCVEHRGSRSDDGMMT